MKINKTLEKTLNTAKGMKKIKKWENYIGAIEIHFNDGTIKLCRTKQEIENTLTEKLIYR